MSVGGLGRDSFFTPLSQPDDVAAPAAAPAPPATPDAGAAGGSAAPAARSAPASAADVWASIARAAPRESPVGMNLDASGTRLPVALGTNGRFTGTPGVDATTPQEIGDGLFRAASLIDDSRKNLFDAANFDQASRRAVLAALEEDLAKVPAGGAPPAGMSELQALQMRSSGTTVLLELMTARGTPENVKREAFATYKGLIEKETNPVLKDSMALHLLRLKNELPANLNPEIQRLGETAAPTRPPYDAWFKDGNSTVNVDWSAGSESKAADIHHLKNAGFKVKSESWDATVLEKTYNVNGRKTTFQVSIRSFAGNMFERTGDQRTHMTVYTGHSNWGRNMRESLADADAGNGGKDKLVLTDLCVGKGEIQMFRDKFPGAHLITTHNSSYFEEEATGDSEGIHAILNTFEGIAARRGYEQIANDVRRENPWQWNHQHDEGIDNNFIFPTDVATRRKVLDEDHDGQADIFDRLVDFNTFHVEEDTAREFTPIVPDRPADALVGTKVHFAAQTINRLSIYSEVFEKRNSYGKVVPGGYFEAKPGETDLFRFEKTRIDGKEAHVIRMNHKYAHMSEEAVRMAACYEWNSWMAANDRSWKLNVVDTKLSGLVLASHSLDTDAGHRDATVWSEFLKAYNLPPIDRGTVERLKEVGHDYYSGSYRTIRELNAALPREQLQALAAVSSGRLGVR